MFLVQRTLGKHNQDCYLLMSCTRPPNPLRKVKEPLKASVCIISMTTTPSQTHSILFFNYQ